MRTILIVGAGVNGVMSAYFALEAGFKVILVEKLNLESLKKGISWSGTRIIRDELKDNFESSNVLSWNKVLKNISFPMESVNFGVKHFFSDKKENLIDNGFLLNTSDVLSYFIKYFKKNPNIDLMFDDEIVHIDAYSGVASIKDKGFITADKIVLTCGKGAETMLPVNASTTRKFQVIAILKHSDSASGRYFSNAFIQHDNYKCWGTPEIGDIRAKLSSSKTCYNSESDAMSFILSDYRKSKFVDEHNKIHPTVTKSCIDSWKVLPYIHENETNKIVLIGKASILIACNGSGFRKSPLHAQSLIG